MQIRVLVVHASSSGSLIGSIQIASSRRAPGHVGCQCFSAAEKRRWKAAGKAGTADGPRSPCAGWSSWNDGQCSLSRMRFPFPSNGAMGCGPLRDGAWCARFPGFHPHLAPGRVDGCYVSYSAWIDLIPRRKFKTLGWGGVTLRRKNGRDLRKIVREWRCGAVYGGCVDGCEAFVVAAQLPSTGVMYANSANYSVKKALDSRASSRL